MPDIHTRQSHFILCCEYVYIIYKADYDLLTFYSSISLMLKVCVNKLIYIIFHIQYTACCYFY